MRNGKRRKSAQARATKGRKAEGGTKTAKMMRNIGKQLNATPIDEVSWKTFCNRKHLQKWHEGYKQAAGRGSPMCDCKKAGRELAAKFTKQLVGNLGKGGRNWTLKAALDLGPVDEWLGLKYHELCD